MNSSSSQFTAHEKNKLEIFSMQNLIPAFIIYL